MDRFDLGFLIDSQDADLLYKYTLKAVCSSSRRIRDGMNRYTIKQIMIHSLRNCIVYRSKYTTDIIGRIDKHVMEL